MLNMEVKVIDRERKVVVMDKGEVLYDKFVLVVGLKVFILLIKGVENEGVFIFKSFDDVRRIKVYIVERKLKKVVVIGVGFIGFEGVEVFVKFGMEVLIVELMDRFMFIMFDKDMVKFV